MVITSLKNEKIKRIAELKDKKGRKTQNAYLVEGVKMVKEAFLYNQQVLCVVGKKEFLAELPAFNGEIIETDDKVLNYLSCCETCQGVMAVVKIPDIKVEQGEISVLLDRVRDPGNLGTIIRTSVAVGVKNVYLLDCVDAYSPKTVRSSMSGIYGVNLISVTSEDVEEISKTTTMICADMDGENVFESDIKGNFCLCMGNEANGVSDFIKEKCKKTVKIPMKNKIESLNVAVAYAIIIYNLVKF